VSAFDQTPFHGASAERVPAAQDATKPSSRSLRGLDLLNFLLADVQAGVGPFLAIYLAAYGWNPQRVGVALTIEAVAGIVAQTPGGALVDQMRAKRTLIASGIVALAIGALLIAFFPSLWPVVSAQARRDLERLYAGDRGALARDPRPRQFRSPPGP
jgi:Major Facilitator Superfamily